MPELKQFIPRSGEVRLGKPYRSPDRRWEEVTKEMYGSTDLPTSIKFAHDSLWDDRFWSIQNAGDQVRTVIGGKVQKAKFGLWSFTAFLFIAADLCFMGWRFRVR